MQLYYLLHVFYVLHQISYSFEQESQQDSSFKNDSAGEEDDIIENTKEHDISNKNGLIVEAKQWENATIYYDISDKFTSTEIKLIHFVFDYYEKLTCLKFKQKTAVDKDYILFELHSSSCQSYIGKVGGKQEIFFAHRCFKKIGVIIHEIMHSLGFFHEQCRSDRDNYIKVVVENIKPEGVENFYKFPDSIIKSYGMPYDYNSILHYKQTAFSKNKKNTIVPLQPRKALHMGQRRRLTIYDLSKIITMYCTSSF